MNAVLTGKMSVTRIIERYSEELRHYKTLWSLAMRQNHYLATGRLTEFLDLVEAKTPVLTRIAELESAPVPPESMLDSYGRVPSHIQYLLDEITALLRKTIAMERDNERLLESRCNNLTGALMRLAEQRARIA